MADGAGSQRDRWFWYDGGVPDYELVALWLPVVVRYGTWAYFLFKC